MGKIFHDDAYCMGLLYGYIYGGKRMQTLDDLKKYHMTIEYNLMNKNVLDMYSTLNSSLPCIYDLEKGKYDEVYLVLKSNIDLTEAVNKYINGFSSDTVKAATMNNSLSKIGLIKIDDNIVPLSTEDKQLKDSNDFINSFVTRLKSGEITIIDTSVVNKLTKDSLINELENLKETLDNTVLYQLNRDCNKELSRKKKR